MYSSGLLCSSASSSWDNGCAWLTGCGKPSGAHQSSNLSGERRDEFTLVLLVLRWEPIFYYGGKAEKMNCSGGGGGGGCRNLLTPADISCAPPPAALTSPQEEGTSQENKEAGLRAWTHELMNCTGCTFMRPNSIRVVCSLEDPRTATKPFKHLVTRCFQPCRNSEYGFVRRTPRCSRLLCDVRSQGWLQ